MEDKNGLDELLKKVNEMENDVDVYLNRRKRDRLLDPDNDDLKRSINELLNLRKKLAMFDVELVNSLNGDKKQLKKVSENLKRVEDLQQNEINELYEERSR